MFSLTSLMRAGLLACAFATIAPSMMAAELPQYFYTNQENSERGAALGTNEDGDPAKWASLHSQFSGLIVMDHLRFSGEPNANWTFLWTRKAGDSATYKLTPSFRVRKEFAGRVALEVGYDGVYHHTQVPWPGGFWVSNETEWNAPFPPSPDQDGTYTLNEEKASLIVPASVEKVYIRVRYIDTTTSPQFAWIESGTVLFEETAAEASSSKTTTTPTQNVVTLGADPSGQQDSTAAIQQALDAGGTIFFPSGQYKISQTLIIRRSGTELRGELGSVIRTAPGAPVSALQNTKSLGVWGISQIVVRDLSFVNDESNYKVGDNLQGTHAIGMLGAKDVFISNVRVLNFQHDGIYIGYCKDVRIEGCSVDGPRHGITINGEFEGGRYGNWNVQVLGCKTTNTWDTGIIVGFHSSYVILDGNLVERSRCHGIDIFNVSHVVVSNNIVHNWNSPHYQEPRIKRSVGIFVHPDWGITTYVPTKDIVISGNQIIYDGEPEEGVIPQAIEVTGNTDTILITGNTLVGGADGFNLRSQPDDQFYKARADKRMPESEIPQNVTFANNICRGQYGRYLWVSGSIEISAVISNNTFAPERGGMADMDMGKSESTIVLSGNIFRDDRLSEEKLSKALILQNNVFLPSSAPFPWMAQR